MKTPCFTDLRPDRRQIGLDDIQPALTLIDRTGLVEQLSTGLAAGRRSPAGRPRTMTLRALLAGMLVDAVEHGTVLFTRVTELLYERLTPPARRELGLDQHLPPGSFEAGYARVRRLLHALLALMNDSPYPHNRRLSIEDFERLTTPLPAEVAAERKALRVEVGNRLLAATVADFHELFRGIQVGSCVDATVVATNARNGSRRERVCSADPDAGVYRRDYAETSSASGAKNNGKIGGAARKEVYGYEATLHLQGPLGNQGTTGHTPPTLVSAFAVERPGVAPGPAAIDAIRHSAAHGLPVGLLAGDRAYNNSRPHDFQLPARQLGYELLFDYRRDQLGIAA